MLPAGRVHRGVLAPTDADWGDLRSGRRRGADDDVGPVLGALGRAAQDLHRQVAALLLDDGAAAMRLALPPEDGATLG